MSIFRRYDQATQDRMINDARYPGREQAEKTGESRASYQEMGRDERLPASAKIGSPEWEDANDFAARLDANPLGYEGEDPAPRTIADLPDVPIPYSLTELGAGQAVADRMTGREVGPGFLEAAAADREAGS